MGNLKPCYDRSCCFFVNMLSANVSRCAACGYPFCEDHLVARLFLDKNRVIQKEKFICLSCFRDKHGED